MPAGKPMDPEERLKRQVAFVAEVDKLKQILRRTVVMDDSRRENAAEHSWHLALMALVFSEHAQKHAKEHAQGSGLDMFRVVKMLLVHDLVEIDAGDTFCYDEQGTLDKEDRETAAAERIFNILPPDQAVEMRYLWDEFEAAQTPEAAFANAMDRFQPVLHNARTKNSTWRRYGITRDQVVRRNQVIDAGAPALWEYAREMIDAAVRKGELKD